MTRKLALIFGLIAALASSALTMGPALADIRIVVPARDIARGEVIADADLTFGTATGTALMNGTVTSMDALNGMEARRMLRAGQAVSVADVRHPILVSRGQTMIVLEAMKIQHQLKAALDAEVESVSVQEGQQVSNRTVLVTMAADAPAH